jgi:curved DNA-binding protein CbpA
VKDFYKILGVKRDATEDQIKKAYRGKAVNAHPDKGGNEEDMAELSRAYSVLKDNVKRIEYDRTGKEPEDTQSLSRDIIMNVFVDILKLPQEPTNCLATATASINNKIQALNNERKDVVVKINNLKQRRNRIIKKTKDNQVNLWQVLIDKQLEGGNNILAELDKRIKAHEDALKMLENYEGDEYLVNVVQTYTYSTSSATGGY